jgi:hypothetical protein
MIKIVLIFACILDVIYNATNLKYKKAWKNKNTENNKASS